MPIIVKDYTWRQTNEIVVVQVPLKGVPYRKADVFTFENYIKVHYAPFLFEVFLYAQIKNSESKCVLTKNEAVFNLYKQTHAIWETLEANLTKTEKQNLRQQIIFKHQEKVKEEKENKEVQKSEIKRAAVREQMALDSEEREYIKKIKDNELKRATKEIEEWKISKAEQITSIPKIVEIDDCSAASENSLEEVMKIKNEERSGPKKENHVIKCSQQKKVKEKHDIFIDKILTKNNEPECVPLPREMGRINISFTPRQFPTPSRESYRAEEEEWLKNQAEARRACGFVAADLKPEEQNPIWLKDKGDSFFQMGNYLGAISAYSHAIKIGSTLPAIYSNRAAAHLAIGNYYKAHEDSSRALELLTPCVSLNAKSRARCFVRRATALCHLGAPENALKDLEKAQALAPETSLIEDIERVRIMIDKLSTGKEG
ncbi:hypothetical protein R5R35_000389 [Gryllus longicercus]|uniref:Dynein axonemal assembly factor 4 n=1 Tax=Gryllus longicercus TaxID=2509291 RepID=A0AAN9V8G6_9ORTH